MANRAENSGFISVHEYQPPKIGVASGFLTVHEYEPKPGQAQVAGFIEVTEYTSLPALPNIGSIEFYLPTQRKPGELAPLQSFSKATANTNIN